MRASPGSNETGPSCVAGRFLLQAIPFERGGGARAPDNAFLSFPS